MKTKEFIDNVYRLGYGCAVYPDDCIFIIENSSGHTIGCVDLVIESFFWTSDMYHNPTVEIIELIGTFGETLTINR